MWKRPVDAYTTVSYNFLERKGQGTEESPHFLEEPHIAVCRDGYENF